MEIASGAAAAETWARVPDRSRTAIVIIGGSVSGLYAARLQEQQGVRDWMLIEGREVLGGRIPSRPFLRLRTVLPRKNRRPAARTGSTWGRRGSGPATSTSCTGWFRNWAWIASSNTRSVTWWSSARPTRPE